MSVRLVAKDRFGELASSAMLHQRPLVRRGPSGDQKSTRRPSCSRITAFSLATGSVPFGAKWTTVDLMVDVTDVSQYSAGKIVRNVAGVTARSYPAPR